MSLFSDKAPVSVVETGSGLEDSMKNKTAKFLFSVDEKVKNLWNTYLKIPLAKRKKEGNGILHLSGGVSILSNDPKSLKFSCHPSKINRKVVKTQTI